MAPPRPLYHPAAQQLLIKMPLWLHVSVDSDKNLSLASIAFLACFRMAGVLKWYISNWASENKTDENM